MLTTGPVKVTWIMLRMIAHSLMVHAQFLEAYIHFALMNTVYNIFPVLPIKDLINEDDGPTWTFKLETVKKPSVSHVPVLFCLCIVYKATAHVNTKALNMCHKVQKEFQGIFVEIIQHQKGYLVYVPQKFKIVYLYNFVFYESFSSDLA